MMQRGILLNASYSREISNFKQYEKFPNGNVEVQKTPKSLLDRLSLCALAKTL